MIIKTFTAESSSAALKMVREEMGGEAIVLKSCRIGDGKNPLFEVTACLEKASVARTDQILSEPKVNRTRPTSSAASRQNENKPVSAASPSAELEELHKAITNIDRKLNQLLAGGFGSGEANRAEMFQSVYRQMKDADLADDYVDSLFSSLTDSYDGSAEITSFARQKLVGEFSSLMIPSINFKPGDRLVFVGPAGCGKSSVMGKLAASLVAVQKQKVKLVTLDDFKMGAADEIYSYADILGLDVVNPSDMPDENSDAVILIDAPAMPNQQGRLTALKDRIDAIKPHYRFAVFSCLTRSRDVFAISKRLKELEPTHLIMTMQDLTSCCGSAVTAARATGLKIAFFSDSPGGMGSLKSPDPDMLVRGLLNVEVAGE